MIEAIRRTPEGERTFIADRATREQKLAAKFNLDTSLVSGKHICVVDDSVVRGSTLKFLSKQLRRAGAVSIHARIAAPKFRYPCFFGIDVPTQAELAVNQFLEAGLASKLELDSLTFLSISGLHRALNFHSLCTGCFTSRYPISINQIRQKTKKEEAVDA